MYWTDCNCKIKLRSENMGLYRIYITDRELGKLYSGLSEIFYWKLCESEHLIHNCVIVCRTETEKQSKEGKLCIIITWCVDFQWFSSISIDFSIFADFSKQMTDWWIEPSRPTMCRHGSIMGWLIFADFHCCFNFAIYINFLFTDFHLFILIHWIFLMFIDV